MACLILLILIVFTIISYIGGKRSFVSPWFLLCIIFLASYLLLLINYNNWNVSISSQFILYISSAIIAFGLGCLLVNHLNQLVAVKPVCNKTDSLGKVIKLKYPLNLFLILTVLLSAVYILKILSDAGDGGSFTDKLRRIYEMGNKYSPGFIFTQCREIITAIAYINTYRILIRIYSKKDTISLIKLLIPVIAFFVVVIISTERNFLLRYAIYFLCLWIMVYKSMHNQKNVNLKILAHVVVISAVIVFLFFIMGKAKQYQSGFFKMISIYAGSGLNNFNLWIQDFNEPLLLGQSTFTTSLDSFGTITNIFGFNINASVSQFDPFIEFVSPNGYVYGSNIYTSLRPYIEDFGYLGVIIVPFIVGMFFQWLYCRAMRKSFSFAWVIYAMLIYSVIYFPIGEQLFRRFHLGLLYELVWIYFVYWFVFKRHRTGNYKEKSKIAKKMVKNVG